MAERTELGIWVPRGKARRELQDKVAAERADFEHEYHGLPIVAFDREQVFEIAMRLAGRDVYVSEAFARETRKRVRHWRRLFETLEPERQGRAARDRG